MQRNLQKYRQILLAISLLGTQVFAQNLIKTPEEKFCVESKTNDYDSALQDLNGLVKSNPTRYIGERALFFETIENNERALSDFNEAVKLNPTLWLFRRARFFESLGQGANALKDYQALIDTLNASGKQPVSLIDWKLGEAYYWRARYYERNNQISEALRDFRHASTLSGSYLLSYANFCEKHGISDSYLEALNGLVARWPEMYLSRRAAFYEGNKEAKLAADDYDRLVKISRKFGPKDGYSPRSWALRKRSSFYHRQGKVELSAADDKLSKHYERLQKKIFGFSAWPVR